MDSDGFASDGDIAAKMAVITYNSHFIDYVAIIE